MIEVCHILLYEWGIVVGPLDLFGLVQNRGMSEAQGTRSKPGGG